MRLFPTATGILRVDSPVTMAASAEFFPLPNYDRDAWKATTARLARASGDQLSSWEDLIALISDLQSRGDGRQEGEDDTDVFRFAQLRAMVENLTEGDSERLCSRSLPSIVDAAASLERHFDDGKLPRLASGREDGATVSLTRRQIRSVLAHMLLCTTTITEHAHVKYWSHFGVWLHGRQTSGPVIGYLRCLFEYFAADLSNELLSDADQSAVSFIRRSLPERTPDSVPQLGSCSELCGLTVRRTGAIGDDIGEIEVDFANEDVSFGRGGTQEEIMIGMSPELCIIPLIADTLAENETLVVQGARRVGDHHGYGLDMVFTGVHGVERRWSERYIVAMDATNFAWEDEKYLRLLRKARGDESVLRVQEISEQLLPEAIIREIRKAYCAFRPLPGSIHELSNSFPIATGLWGCGAYGGDCELKVVIQWIAASEARRCLSFYTFGDEKLATKLETCTAQLRRLGKTVGDLLGWIEQFSTFIKDNGSTANLSLLSFILDQLRSK